MAITRHNWSDGVALAQGLAQDIAMRLTARLAQAGEAYLAVSGGQTPIRLFEALARIDIDWPGVTITLVDERWVDESSPRSNAAQVRRHLLTDKAAAARFLPLYSPGHAPEAGWLAAELRLRMVTQSLTVAVLGMGEDGHTASFFPGGDRLEAALDPGSKRVTEIIRAPGAGEPRITLTLATLRSAGGLVLHIEGKTKRRVLERALAPGSVPELPVRAILQQGAVPVDIHWAP
jgi:6-phosphogluconolactonase